MAEISVKNQTCPTCGVEVRPDTQFCYNCGGAVTPEAEASLKDGKGAVQPTLREKLAELGNGDSGKPTNKLDIADIGNKPLEKPEIKKDVELKSAASMRRKSKIFQPKKVEVIWEEHENAPNLRYILVAVILTLFAAGLLYMASYLK